MNTLAFALQRQIELTASRKLSWRRTTPNQLVHKATDRLFVLFRQAASAGEEVRYSEHRIEDGYVCPPDVEESSLGERGHLVSALWGAAVGPPTNNARPIAMADSGKTGHQPVEARLERALSELVNLEDKHEALPSRLSPTWYQGLQLQTDLERRSSRDLTDEWDEFIWTADFFKHLAIQRSLEHLRVESQPTVWVAFPTQPVRRKTVYYPGILSSVSPKK